MQEKFVAGPFICCAWSAVNGSCADNKHGVFDHAFGRDPQAAGAERYVVDIRSNSGGSFPAGIEVAKMWLNDGDIVLIADSTGVRRSPPPALTHRLISRANIRSRLSS